MTTTIPVRWLSPVPKACDLCGLPIGAKFVDGRFRTSTRWAYMCPPCHAAHGAGLGVGLGQRYERQEDGSYVKAEG